MSDLAGPDGPAPPGPATGPTDTGRPGLWAPDRRATTLGILLLISLTAFEAMGVGTAMPAVVADLGGLDLYAWPFVTFLAAAVFGTKMKSASAQSAVRSSVPVQKRRRASGNTVPRYVAE